MADDPFVMLLPADHLDRRWWVAIDAYGAAGKRFDAASTWAGLQCVPLGDLAMDMWAELTPESVEGLCGLMTEIDRCLAVHLVADFAWVDNSIRLSAPRSKVVSTISHAQLESGFLACGCNFLPLADVLGAVRQRWRRLAFKLWLMKSVGLGMIPALVHVGGRDLGDYV